MKKLCFLLASAILLLGVNTSINAQTIAIPVEMSHISLGNLFEIIQNQSPYAFVYDRSQVDLDQKFKVTTRTGSVEVILESIFNKDAKYSYMIVDKSIVVTRKAEPKKQKISGLILDSSTDEPIVGAGIQMKGDFSVGTITDIYGAYALDGVPSDAILIISSIGYKTKEINVGGMSIINVKLDTDVNLLDEVVVVGYGTMDKKELTSAIAHISSKNFISTNSSDPSMLIQGKVAGVSITNTAAGDPNNSASIQIRGVSSRAAGTGPLIVINGVPGGDMSNLNPDDIESFDILKDGAASAIYGVRASNGVIIITTKKASTDGHVHTSYSATVSIDSPMYELHMLSPQEWRDYRVEDDGVGYDLGGNVDWLKRITQVGWSHKHTLSFSAGNEKTNYRVTADYKSAEGIDIRSARREYGARASVNHTTQDGLFTFSANVSPRIVNLKNSDWNVFKYAIETNPTTPIMSVDDPSLYFDFLGQPAGVNSVELLKTELSDNEKKWIDWDGTVKLNLLPLLSDGKLSQHNLSTQVTYSGRFYDDLFGWFRPSYNTIAIRSGKDGQAKRSYSKFLREFVEWLANYQGTFDGHNLKLMTGYSYTYEQNQILSAENSDFANDALTYNNIGSGAYMKEEGEVGMSSYKADSKLAAFFGRISYDWKGRYLLTASLRYEGSSKFGTKNKWGLFPAASAGWRISDEPFIQGAGWLNDLKIRGDFGVTGNQDFDSYQSLSTMQAFGEYYYNGEFFQVWGPSKNVNPDLKWEKGINWNIGLDWSMFNYQLSGSFNYFNRTQQDLLGSYNVSVPPYLFNSTFVNVGTMSNTGFEFEISWKAVNKKDIGYTISAVGATMSNEFKSFSNSEFVGQDYYDTAVTASPYPNLYLQRIEEGHRIGSFYMFKYAGIDTEGNWVVYSKDGDLIKASDAMDEDKRYVGNGLPKFTGSMTHSLRIKNFDLSVFLTTALGYDLFNIHDFMYGHRNYNGNVLKKAYGKNYAINPDMGVIVSDYFLERGDYLKIDAVTLGYNFNLDIKYLKKIGLYATAKNLYTFTGFSGIDPSSYQTNGLTPGANSTGAYYPSSRQFIFGVNIEF